MSALCAGSCAWDMVTGGKGPQVHLSQTVQMYQQELEHKCRAALPPLQDTENPLQATYADELEPNSARTGPKPEHYAQVQLPEFLAG